MDDRSIRKGYRVPLNAIALAIASVMLALCVDACAQSTLRVLDESGLPLPGVAPQIATAPRVPDLSIYRIVSLPAESRSPARQAPAPRQLPVDAPAPLTLRPSQPENPDVFPSLSAAAGSERPDVTPIPPRHIVLAQREPKPTPSQPAAPTPQFHTALKSVLRINEPVEPEPQPEPVPAPRPEISEPSPPTDAVAFDPQPVRESVPEVVAEPAPTSDREPITYVIPEPFAYSRPVPVPEAAPEPAPPVVSARPRPMLLSSQPIPAPKAAPAPAPSAPIDREEVLVPSRPYRGQSCDSQYGCPYYPTQSGAHSICGVDCGPYGAGCCETWANARPIPWSLFGPGEYVGPPRPEHVPVYYLRVNDLVTLTYIVSRQKQSEQYRIGVNDGLRIESSFDNTLDREIHVQPDGDIILPLIGEVPAAGKTVKELREELVRRYSEIERDPIITITLLEFNGGLREILNAVTSQSRLSGQAIDLRVSPEGTIQAPGLSSIYVQGLTIEELRAELEARYMAVFGPGLLISPALSERATSYVFVGGEVTNPGRYTLEGPTTVMQAIALAGGWNNGGNMREVVIFRRDENWCLKATKVNIFRPLYGKDPCPVNDVWLRDNDLIVVPKTKILCAADVIELYFTRGVYAVFPITYVKDFSRGTSVVPVGP